MPKDTTLHVTARTSNEEIYAEVSAHYTALAGKFDSESVRNQLAAECDGYMAQMFAERKAQRQGSK